MPSRDEVKKVLEFTEKLFGEMCNILDIDKDELK